MKGEARMESLLQERTVKLEEAIEKLKRERAKHKQSEEKIARLHHQQSLILNSASEGILGLDTEGRHIFVNPAAAKMLGYEPGELIGRQSHSIWHHTKPDGRPYPAEECPVYAAFRDGAIHHVTDEVFWRKDGASFPAEYTSTPILENGRLAGAVVTFRDMTERKQSEEAQRDQAEQYASIMATTSDGFWLLDGKGKILDANERYCQMSGYTREELLSRSISDIEAVESADVIAARVKMIITSGSARFEACHRTKNGRAMDVEISSTWLASKGYFITFIRDITERKRSERVRKQLAAIFENTTDMVATADPTGRLTFMNPAGRRMLGIGKDEDVSAVKISETHTPRAFEVVQREGVPTAIREGVWHGETELRSREGRLIPVSQMILAHRASDGSVEFVSTIMRDISESKQAKTQIERLSRFPEENPNPVLRVSARGVLEYANAASDALLPTMGAKVGGAVNAEWQARMAEALAMGHPSNIEFRVGDRMFVATLAPVVNRGYVNLYAREVTREVQLEAQLRQAQKMENIGRLAGGVAHDFNNLLMAIMGYNDMTLKALPAKDPLRKHLEEVRTAGKRAVALTRQLLAFSRKQVLRPRVLDLNDLAGNLSKMLRQLIGEDIRLTTMFDPALGRVMADPGQIEQVITNLAVNARDAMPEGGMLTLQTANADLDAAYASQHEEVTPGRYVLLTVSDTGTGMSDEVKAHLFEPFFTTKEQGKGTGLGLPTVFGIVKQSGGHITAYSEVGHGTAFKIYLPRVEETAEVVLPAAPVESPRGTETILLVEDEDQVRELARMALEECGYTVWAADNGPDAIQLAEQHEGKIQLLMTDVIMPEMSGRVLAPLLMSLNPGIKVLYMSGYTDAAVVRQDLLAAGSAFLQKPFSLEVLARTVREVLDGGGGREERQKAERWKLKSEVGGRWSGR